LRAFAKRKVLKVVAETSGVFHPKLVIGVKGDEVRAIVGSSNFTGGGYGFNAELNVLIEGASEDPALASILAFADAQWHSLFAFVPDHAWLESYETAWSKRPKPPKAPAPPGPRRVARESDLNIDFARFFEVIAAQELRLLACGHRIRVFDADVGSYLQEAEACQAAFALGPGFVDIQTSKQKLIAGWGDESTGYFGSMKGAGRFMALVLHKPVLVARHLDRLPLTGPVSREVADDVLRGLVSIRGVALGTASRLLTVKRPDLFLTVNSANKDRISEVFDAVPSTVEQYLALHDRIWSFPWASEAAPDRDVERRVWAARVALLDAVLYETTSRKPGRA